jgi:hypothetical protein
MKPAVCCDYSNEQSVSIKDGQILDYLSDYQRPNNRSAPWVWSVLTERK